MVILPSPTAVYVSMNDGKMANFEYLLLTDPLGLAECQFAVGGNHIVDKNTRSFRIIYVEAELSIYLLRFPGMLCH